MQIVTQETLYNISKGNWTFNQKDRRLFLNDNEIYRFQEDDEWSAIILKGQLVDIHYEIDNSAGNKNAVTVDIFGLDKLDNGNFEINLNIEKNLITQDYIQDEEDKKTEEKERLACELECLLIRRLKEAFEQSGNYDEFILTFTNNAKGDWDSEGGEHI